MSLSRRAALAGAALALLAAAAGGPLRSGFAAPRHPTILAAIPDLAAGTLTIEGRDLARGGEAPDVTLGGAALVVVSASEETVVAELPPDAAGRNHLLAVRTGGHRMDSAAIWIPGEGIVTRGGIRIESTESDVRILAGASRITVDPAGGILLQSAGPMTLDAQGALSLRGNSVRIDSATSLRLAAPTIDLAASGNANVSAAGTMNVTGALIRLN
jgi:hypothetical protein